MSETLFGGLAIPGYCLLAISPHDERLRQLVLRRRIASLSRNLDLRQRCRGRLRRNGQGDESGGKER